MQLFREDVKNGDGFSTIISGTKTIVINDKKGSRKRRRFTMGHELGHCLLNHPLEEIQFRNSENDNESLIFEYEANVFARDVLMPATILAKLDIHNTQQIMELCDISKLSAELRLKRLEELYDREEKFLKERGYSCFGLDRREQTMLINFKNFINTHI